jgi:mRNA-degrading endonuclease HigB of HigAB toxin-antitoxin module
VETGGSPDGRRGALPRTPVRWEDGAPATDHVTADRLVFDVGGNKWRIVARVDYQARMVFIRWIGDHKAYDKIDAATV